MFCCARPGYVTGDQGGRNVSEHPAENIEYPGSTGDMSEQPHDEMRSYQGRGLLQGKKALITGGDSGIGRAVAVAYAKEGADVAIAYLDESDDAAHTKGLVEPAGRRCTTSEGDLDAPTQCRQIVGRPLDDLGAHDTRVKNHDYQNL